MFRNFISIFLKRVDFTETARYRLNLPTQENKLHTHNATFFFRLVGSGGWVPSRTRAEEISVVNLGIEQEIRPNRILNNQTSKHLDENHKIQNRKHDTK